MRSFLLLISVCIICITGCTKIDNTSLGSELIPAVDNVNTFETIISVVANNFDSLNCTTIFATDNHVLGYISNDPYFGKTTAAIYAELKPSSFPFVLPTAYTNISIDSVVLVLNYTGAYGDTLSSQKVDVYQVSTPGFKFDSSTCSNQTHDELLLGSGTFTSSGLRDSVFGFNDTSSNQLRIRLDNAFAQSLLSNDTNTIYKSDSLFKEFFKGFAILPDTNYGGNALTYFNITDTNTKLAFYFKYPVTTTKDTTVVVNFRFTPGSASANTIVRNHAGAELNDHLQHPSSGDDVIYIQTAPGNYAEIKLPALDTISNRIIHRAELIMEQVYSPAPSDGYFIPPGYLYLEVKNADTSFMPIPCDFTVLSGSPNLAQLGGFKKDAKDGSGSTIARYTFNISRYVQKVITDVVPNYTLKLSAPDYINNDSGYLDKCNQPIPLFNYFINNPAFGRVKLGGGNNPQYAMRLRLVYSRL